MSTNSTNSNAVATVATLKRKREVYEIESEMIELLKKQNDLRSKFYDTKWRDVLDHGRALKREKSTADSQVILVDYLIGSLSSLGSTKPFLFTIEDAPAVKQALVRMEVLDDNNNSFNWAGKSAIVAFEKRASFEENNNIDLSEQDPDNVTNFDGQAWIRGRADESGVSNKPIHVLLSSTADKKLTTDECLVWSADTMGRAMDNCDHYERVTEDYEIDPDNNEELVCKFEMPVYCLEPSRLFVGITSDGAASSTGSQPEFVAK